MLGSRESLRVIAKSSARRVGGFVVFHQVEIAPNDPDALDALADFVLTERRYAPLGSARQGWRAVPPPPPLEEGIGAAGVGGDGGQRE